MRAGHWEESELLQVSVLECKKKNSSVQYASMMCVNFCDLVSFQMKWLSVLPQQCLLLLTCLLMALEAVPIDIDKTKIKAEGHVEGEKVENPVSIK